MGFGNLAGTLVETDAAQPYPEIPRDFLLAQVQDVESNKYCRRELILFATLEQGLIDHGDVTAVGLLNGRPPSTNCFMSFLTCSYTSGCCLSKLRSFPRR